MAAIAILGAGSSAACSLLFSTDEQCSTTAECVGKGAAFAGTTCVESVCVSATTQPDATTDAADTSPIEAAADAADADPFACGKVPPLDDDPSQPVVMTLQNLDLSAGAPATAIDVRLCAVTDALCANPRTALTATDAGAPDANATGSGIDAGAEGGTGWVSPAKDGVIIATAEVGFEGFFEIRSNTYFPTVRFTSPPLRNGETYNLDEIMLRGLEIQFFAMQATGGKKSYNPAKGLVFTLARDCNQVPLQNVSFSATSVDSEQFEFYVINTTPSVDDTKTDQTGRGGFVNVPPGLTTFTAYYADTGVKIGSTRALVRAGYNTTLSILPSPVR